MLLPPLLDKRSLRRNARMQAALEWNAISPLVAARIATLPEFAAAQHVLLYLATEREISVEELARQFPTKCWYAPRCVENGGLTIHSFRHDETPLTYGAYGLREPDPAHSPQTTDRALLDLVLVPGLLFTPTGDRLGQGGGYYDRFLPQLRTDCLTVGVGCEKALAVRLPLESWDQRVDLVATERNIYDARPK